MHHCLSCLIGSMSILEKSDEDKINNSAFVMSLMLTYCIIVSRPSIGSLSIGVDVIILKKFSSLALSQHLGSQTLIRPISQRGSESMLLEVEDLMKGRNIQTILTK